MKRNNIKNQIKNMIRDLTYIPHGEYLTEILGASKLAYSLNYFTLYSLNDLHPETIEYYYYFRDISRQEAIEPISQLLKNGGIYKGTALACALAGMKDIKTVKPLINALDDPHINRKCAYNLTRISKLSLYPLIDTLNHENPIVRQEVAWALGEIGNKEALKPLLHSLKDKNCKVKHNIIEAIGKIGNMKQYDQIYPFLYDNNNEVCKKAKEALIAFEIGENIPNNKIKYETQLKDYLVFLENFIICQEDPYS